MDVKQVLEELVAIPEQPERIASVYLDTRRDNEHQRQEVRVFVAEESRRLMKAASSEAERERLRPTLDKINEYVAGVLRQQNQEWARGIALFCSNPLGLFRVVAARLPFSPMQFTLGSRPRVLPFLRVCGAVPPVIAASVDSEGADFYEISCGAVDSEARLDRPFPGFHSRGGWRQRRIQQRLGELRDRNLRDVANRLVELADRHPDGVIVLLGQTFILKKFEQHLPERYTQRILTRLSTIPNASDGEKREALLAAAAPAIESYRRVRDAALRDLVLAEASRGGPATMGLEPTLLALNEGFVHELLVNPDSPLEGTVCSACAALGPGSDQTCRYCNSSVRHVELVEEAVRRAVKARATIAYLPPGEPLPDGAPMGALLRQRAGAQSRAVFEEAAPE